MRACAGCRRKNETEKFIRFVIPEGTPVIDVTRKAPGRGFNVCPTYSCIRNFVRRTCKGRVNPEVVYNQSVEALKGYLLHLLSLSHKTGVTVIGQDNIKHLPPEREGVLILSTDLSQKTKERLKRNRNCLVLEGIFPSETIGGALKKDTSAGAVFVEKVGIGRKLYNTAEKLKSLINSREG